MGMTASEYNNLDLDQKANTLWTYGQMVHERREYNKFKVCIYGLGAFYVELSYCIKDNTVRRIRALENASDWQGYLNSVELADLMAS